VRFNGRVREHAMLQPMSFVDLIKATVMCAGVAFLIYTFPVLAQGLIIGGLTLLWLSYARKTVVGWLRR
jgi:hypothetical protein